MLCVCSCEEMLFGCWIAALLLLLLLLLLPAAAPQSGAGEPETEPRISCTSDIMTTGSSLSCKLVGGRSDDEDDEDYEADGMKKMTVCFSDQVTDKDKCLEAFDGTITSTELHPALLFNVTVHLKRGGTIRTIVNLRTIIKPRSPRVKNVTFDKESHQAVIHVQTPYHNGKISEYLRKNLLFQMQLSNTSSTITLNYTSHNLKVPMDRLSRNTKYQVKVRVLPEKGMLGTWSDWSEPFSFSAPAGEDAEEVPEVLMVLIVCFVSLAVLLSSLVLFWKNKRIVTYMWPSIPRPKHTLLQICKPDKGLLLNLKPEVISTLQVEAGEEQQCEEAEPSMAAAAASPPCSAQSSDSSRSTTSTEELELSALLSRGSSDGEDSLQSASLSPVQDLERPPTPQPEHGGGANEAEAYVTMSSFYQIK